MSTGTVLLAGFEPFGGERVNPALEVVRALAGRSIGGHAVVSVALPVTFAAAGTVLVQAIAREQPTLVLALGQAGGRACISIERVAINLVDARIPDNAGSQPIDTAVIAGAPAAYFASVPVKAMRAALQEAGIPAELSFSAGSYVCNAVFFALMHALTTTCPHTRGGFIHIPWLPLQAAAHGGAPSMALDTVVNGMAVAIAAALDHTDDLRLAGGATH